MKFDRIIINNLFSYYGKQVFDLTGSKNNKNIVLIHGRNGHGKTNFLNSLKLFFCSSEDKALRKLGSSYNRESPTTIGARKFIDGDMPNWEGIRNRQAVRKEADDYSITVEWHEGDDNILAKRSWPIPLRNNKGELRIIIGDQILPDEDAPDFLEDRLPSDLVPYFHFDGELIRDIAEAADAKSMTGHIERLLELSRLKDLHTQCNEVLKGFNKLYADKELIQEELDLEAEIATILANRNKRDKLIEDISNDISSIESRRIKVDKEIENIIDAGTLHDEDALRIEQEKAQDRLEEACQRFVALTTFDLPLAINSNLSKRVMSRLSEMQRDDIKGQRYILDKLRKVLPEELFGLPPYSSPKLTTNQETFFIKKLNDILHNLVSGLDQKTHWKVGIDRIDSLPEDFSSFVLEAKNRRARGAEVLRQIREENKTLKRIEEELLDASGLGQQSRLRYEKLKQEQLELADKHGAKTNQLDSYSKELTRINEKLNIKEKQLEKVRRKIEIATQGKNKVELLKKGMVALDNYRNLMRDEYREDIAKKVNEHFFQILDSFDLIAEIKLTEDFIPEYFDSSGQPVGRYSVSAGTKQLIATSFLWALKQVSERPVPVIVDTPLARIDKRHQHNLLERFYPMVSEQVIMLPTDSELDKEKYSLVKKHVYREYKLENPTGIRTNVTSQKMY